VETQLKLAELVPLATLEHLRMLFKSITGIPMTFTDPEGVPITTVCEPICFCGSLVRGDQGTVCLRRNKWDVPEPAVEAALREEREGDKPIQHHCRGGFRDTAAPIAVADETVGYAVFARSLPAEPNLDKFRRLAVEGGMPPEVGEQVAHAALVMPRERIAEVAEFLHIIAGLVARAAYDSILAQRILELEELRESLIHMIVHDLRTPLTSIIGGLQLIVDTEYEQELTEEFVSAGLVSAKRLLEMVNTLLDINKMEKGELELDLGEVDFNHLAEQAGEQLAGLVIEHNHDLELDLDRRCPPIWADAEKLQRVIVNLLGNAVQFTPGGGHIRLQSHCTGDMLQFSVSDDGPGIPEQEQDRIFEKFGQAETRREGHKYSTGLGLTFCKMVAEAHGGRIWVDSELGKGSTFSVSIPARAAHSGQKANQW